MREWSLDAEFKIYKDIHRMTILQAKLITYYRTVQESGIKIPFFMLESPEKRAEREVQELFDKDKETFNALYEKAWAQYAECLP
jgi:hypothetical protein